MGDECGIYQPFITNDIQLVYDDEEEGKEGDLLFKVARESIYYHILLSLTINYLIVIFEHFGDPFLLLREGSSLFEKLFHVTMIGFDLENFPKHVWTPHVHTM